MSKEPEEEWDLRSDAALGEQLHRLLTEEYGVETEAWATERITRVLERLNAVRERCPFPGANPYPLRAEILWVGEMNAFAAPGGWVYITRELLQRFCTDDPVAFVIAHEMAHHDLGHVRILSGTLAERLRQHLPEDAAALALLLWKNAQNKLSSSDLEVAADRYALDLCIAAGYNPYDCLNLFHALESYYLDHRDLDGVFGPDCSPSSPSDSLLNRALNLAQGERWKRSRGYPSLRARKATLLRQIQEYTG
jgi:predicted Zn-dependent protease